MIADGALAREEVSLQSIRAWLIAHPDRAAAVMQTNRSYIFFAETPLGDLALGSKGSLGANLTPLASLAVDSRIHALGAPFYVAAQGPDPVHAMMVAQDIGGAIRGAARGDVFFGFGPDAERRILEELQQLRPREVLYPSGLPLFDPAPLTSPMNSVDAQTTQNPALPQSNLQQTGFSVRFDHHSRAHFCEQMAAFQSVVGAAGWSV